MKKLKINIDGKRCATKLDLFNEFAFKCKFPDYFSNNWDSFDEIINDTDIFNVQDYDDIIISISSWKYLLKINDNDKEIFMNIFNNNSAWVAKEVEGGDVYFLTTKQ